MSDTEVPSLESRADESNIVRILLDEPHRVHLPDFSIELFSIGSREMAIAQAIQGLQSGKDEVTPHTIAQAIGDPGLGIHCKKLLSRKHIASWEQSTGILRSKLQRRRGIALVSKFHAKFNQHPDAKIETLVAEFETEARRVRANSGSGSNALGDTRELEEEVRWRAENPGKVFGMRFGMRKIEKKMDGLRPGYMTLIAARPSIGKTAFLLSMMTNMLGLGYQGSKIIPNFHSLEMTVPRIQARLVTQLSGVSIVAGEAMTAQELDGFYDGLESLRKFPGLITRKTSLPAILSSMRQAHGEIGANVFFVDYIGLVQVPGVDDDRIRISAASNALKLLAEELGVAMVVAAQLRRPDNVMIRSGKDLSTRASKPTLEHLKGSGSLEEDADVVGLLERDGEHASINLAKNRDGPTGSIDFGFNEQLMRYKEEVAT